VKSIAHPGAVASSRTCGTSRKWSSSPNRIRLISGSLPVPPITSFALIDRMGLGTLYARWHRALAEVTAYYDFCGANSITNDAGNFIDTMHVKPERGRLILARLFETRSTPGPADFGRPDHKGRSETRMLFNPFSFLIYVPIVTAVFKCNRDGSGSLRLVLQPLLVFRSRLFVQGRWAGPGGAGSASTRSDVFTRRWRVRPARRPRSRKRAPRGGRTALRRGASSGDARRLRRN